MDKVYVIIRKTPIFTEVYAVCSTMNKAQERVRNSVYPRSEFSIVEKEIEIEEKPVRWY